MPLVTEWKRDGERVKPPGGWDWTMLSAFMTAAFKEGSPEMEIKEGLTFDDLAIGEFVDFSMAPIYCMTGCALVEEGKQVLERDHEFRLGGDRVAYFKAGDTLQCWRESNRR